MRMADILKNKFFIIAVSSIATIALILMVLSSAGLFEGKKIKTLQEIDTKAPGTVEKSTVSLNPEKMKIVPLISDSTGVEPESPFKIICDEEYPETLIKTSLNIQPQVNFNVKSTSSKKEFNLTFDSPLDANSIYKFQIADSTTSHMRSWAFQTKKTFRLVRTLPRDEAVQVPVDTGIEMTFSHENIKGIESCFEITPKAEGRFEHHNKTVVFVPKKLEEGTVYTIAIKKGLRLKGSEDKTEEDYTFKFQTAPKKTTSYYNHFSFTKDMYNFSSQIAPILQVYSSDSYKDKEFDVDIFKYKDEGTFLEDIGKYNSEPRWAITNKDALVFNTIRLEDVSSFKTKIARIDDNYWTRDYLCFPSKLDEGYYLIRTKIDERTDYAHVQINDASVYIMAGKNETLAWVNHSITGEPITGAKLEALESASSAVTDEDGIAVIQGANKPSADLKYRYFKVKIDGKPAFFALAGSGAYNPYRYYDSYEYYKYNNATNEYWKYLYLDKSLYLPNDIVNVWGIIKPRESEKLPSKGTLLLNRYDYTYLYDSGLEALDSKEIELSPDGTFESSMSLTNFNPGYYNLSVKLGDRIIAETSFQVKEYTKPLYKIELTSDKNAAFAREKANIDVKASFFEGSPVPGLELSYYYYSNKQNEGKIKCDTEGKASLEAELVTHTDSSWQPRNISFYVNNANAEEQEVRAWSNILVFPSDTMIETKNEVTDGKCTVKVKTSLVDLDRIKDKPGSYFSVDEYRGKPIDITLDANIFERYWDSREIGEYYDFINKKVVKKYDYFEVTKPVGELKFATANGVYEFDFPVEEKKNYHVVISGCDRKYNRIQQTEYIYGYASFWPYSSDFKGYSLAKDDMGNEKSYKTGEKVSLLMKHNGNELSEDKTRKFLYITLKNGILGYMVTENPKYSFDFSSNYIPNMFVKALCFDGNIVNDAGIQEVRYDYSEKELKINVLPDKTDYKPGDTVNLDIEVKDINKSPCSAKVNISIVDEAFFAVQDQYVNILQTLYTPLVSPGIICDFISNEFLDEALNPQAEKGEGGDEYVRYDFKDNAFFDTITTDENGKASLSFKLPHNLTSWRITYQGVTNDLKAGNGKTNINSKLPFFVDTIFNKVFIEGDIPYITLRSFGTQLKDSDRVEYTVTVNNDNGYVKKYTAEGLGNKPVNVLLGELKTDSYKVTAEAKSKSLKDALQRDFKVVASLLEAGRVNYYSLASDTVIEGGKGLTTLMFSNDECLKFYRELMHLKWSFGERIDQKISRKIAEELLKKYYDEEPVFEEGIDIKDYQLNDGGIALLTYDSSNTVLSAKIASLAKHYIDQTSLKMYFYKILDNKDSTPEDVAASYWGLASLNEPVLVEIKNLIESSNPKTIEMLYLGNALAEIGDFDGALEIYSNITNKYGKSQGIYYYVDEGRSRDETLEITSLCSIIALKVNAPEKQGLFNYVKDNSTSELLTNLECLIYVTNHIPDVSQECAFSYELDGAENNIRLEKTDTFELVLTEDKLGKIKFFEVEGNVALASSFTGPVIDLMEDSGKLVNIQRTYSVDGKNKLSFKQSDLIKITLQPVFKESAPDGYYEITDILPAGLRYVSRETRDKEVWHPREASGQKMVFGLYYNRKHPGNKNIVYYAKAVTPGSFIADNAVIKHYISSASGFTDRVKVEIKKQEQ